MMYVMKPESYNSFAFILEDYLSNAEQRKTAPGSTKKAGEARAFAKIAFRDGIATGLAALGNQMRCERYSKFDMIGQLVDFDFDGYLMTMESEFTKRMAAITFPNGVPSPQERRDAEAEVRAKFFGEAHDIFLKIVYSDEMESNEIDRHREAVLAGTEEPTESDREWLQELHDRAQSHMAEVEKLLQPKGRPIADAPQA